LITITDHAAILHNNSRFEQQMEASTTDQHSPSNIGTIQRLQDENAALKAELQALRPTTQLQASQPESRKEQTFDFLGLPAELRDAIYELCVSVGEIRIAYCNQTRRLDMRYNAQRDRKAEMSLFGVSKAIRCEALQLYLSKNHSVIPTTDVWSYSIHSPNFRCYMLQHRGTSLVHEHLRSISISFNCADIFERAVNDITATNFIDFHYESDTEQECDAILQSHNELAFERCREFADTLCNIFVDHQQLRRVQINLPPAGCCTVRGWCKQGGARQASIQGVYSSVGATGLPRYHQQKGEKDHPQGLSPMHTQQDHVPRPVESRSLRLGP
jgi:hypothetical protein